MSPAARTPTDRTGLAPERMEAHAADARNCSRPRNEQRLHILCNLLDGPLSVGELNQRSTSASLRSRSTSRY